MARRTNMSRPPRFDYESLPEGEIRRRIEIYLKRDRKFNDFLNTDVALDKSKTAMENGLFEECSFTFSIAQLLTLVPEAQFSLTEWVQGAELLWFEQITAWILEEAYHTSYEVPYLYLYGSYPDGTNKVTPAQQKAALEELEDDFFIEVLRGIEEYHQTLFLVYRKSSLSFELKVHYENMFANVMQIFPDFCALFDAEFELDELLKIAKNHHPSSWWWNF